MCRYFWYGLGDTRLTFLSCWERASKEGLQGAWKIMWNFNESDHRISLEDGRAHSSRHRLSTTIQVELLLEGNKHRSSGDSLREMETMKIKGELFTGQQLWSKKSLGSSSSRACAVSLSYCLRLVLRLTQFLSQPVNRGRQNSSFCEFCPQSVSLHDALLPTELFFQELGNTTSLPWGTWLLCPVPMRRRESQTSVPPSLMGVPTSSAQPIEPWRGEGNSNSGLLWDKYTEQVLFLLGLANIITGQTFQVAINKLYIYIYWSCIFLTGSQTYYVAKGNLELL